MWMHCLESLHWEHKTVYSNVALDIKYTGGGQQASAGLISVCDVAEMLVTECVLLLTCQHLNNNNSNTYMHAPIIPHTHTHTLFCCDYCCVIKCNSVCVCVRLRVFREQKRVAKAIMSSQEEAFWRLYRPPVSPSATYYLESKTTKAA